MIEISSDTRKDVLNALRRGTVPADRLDLLAVGLERFEGVIDEELANVGSGKGVFRAIRGEYGAGKTFILRYITQRARERSFATSEIQVSESETPLHKLEKVYRRLIEELSTREMRRGALRTVIDSWFFMLDEEVISAAGEEMTDEDELLEATNNLMEKRLSDVTRQAPAFSACLRTYRKALANDDHELAEGLIAWLSGTPNVAASVKRAAGIKGDIDHFGALGFLSGLLTILRDSGHGGLVLVLDEVETLQRMRGDTRDKALNALRQLMDEIESGRFPGLYLIITGTPAFFDGNAGVSRLPPLAQRLHVDFATDSRFDNPRAVQMRLPGFDMERLLQVGRRVRDIFAAGAQDSKRIQLVVSDSYLEQLAQALVGELGGEIGIAPRLFLRKLVADVLDRVDQFAEFDPAVHYQLTLSKSDEMSEVEHSASRAATSAADIELEIKL